MTVWLLGALLSACESEPLPACPEHASPPLSGCPELRADGCPEHWYLAEKLPCEHEGKLCARATPGCEHESYFIAESMWCSHGQWTYGIQREGACGGARGL